MYKIKLDETIYERARTAAAKAGYSSVDEFISHCIELELNQLETDEAEEQVSDQLRGLGYIE
jgi:hypothetical protein